MTATIKASNLLAILKATAPVVSTDTTRLYLNQLLIEWNASEVSAIGTDGHRLTIASTPTNSETEGKAQFTLQTVKELVRALKAATTKKRNPDVIVGASGVTICGSGETFPAREDAPAFPPFRQVIPETTETTFTIDPEALATAANGLAHISRGVRLTVTDDALHLEADVEGGAGIMSAKLATSESQNASKAKLMGINAAYLHDAAKGAAGFQARVSLGRGDYEPTQIQASGPEYKYHAVVMPMRL